MFFTSRHFTYFLGKFRTIRLQITSSNPNIHTGVTMLGMYCIFLNIFLKNVS